MQLTYPIQGVHVVKPYHAALLDIAGRLPNPVQVLHLWSPDDDFLPDFARGGNTI